MKEFNEGYFYFGNLYRISKAFEKAKKEPITVCFLGGSITQGANSTRINRCYASLSQKWFKNKFKEVSFINAGIGATTSVLGSARADEQVIAPKADIVMIDFSVNDENTEEFLESYESLIRKLLKSGAAVLLMHNLYYDDGRNAQEIHKMTAKHYQLSGISIRDALYPKILSGGIIREEITEDMLHPNDKGHKLLADLVCDFFEEIYKRCENGEAEQDYSIPKKFTQARLENAVLYNNKFPAQLDGFEIDSRKRKAIKDVFKEGWLAGNAGDSITIEIPSAKLVYIGFQRYKNKNAPVAQVFVNGKSVRNLDANFELDWGDKCEVVKISDSSRAKKCSITVKLLNSGKNPFNLLFVIA